MNLPFPLLLVMSACCPWPKLLATDYKTVCSFSLIKPATRCIFVLNYLCMCGSKNHVQFGRSFYYLSYIEGEELPSFLLVLNWSWCRKRYEAPYLVVIASNSRNCSWCRKRYEAPYLVVIVSNSSSMTMTKQYSVMHQIDAGQMHIQPNNCKRIVAHL